jgi:hypothetical protein
MILYSRAGPLNPKPLRSERKIKSVLDSRVVCEAGAIAADLPVPPAVGRQRRAAVIVHRRRHRSLESLAIRSPRAEVPRGWPRHRCSMAVQDAGAAGAVRQVPNTTEQCGLRSLVPSSMSYFACASGAPEPAQFTLVIAANADKQCHCRGRPLRRHRRHLGRLCL